MAKHPHRFYGGVFMKHGEVRFMSCMYVLSLVLLVGFAANGLRQTAAVSGSFEANPLIILDAGHGGIDGGCSAADGTLEREINLQVTLKTDAVFGLLGENTLLTRNSPEDLSDSSAQTIAQKKISDIRNRTALVNSHPEAVLISIHQNAYTDKKYSGAQVFYGSKGISRAIAGNIQNALTTEVDSSNKRTAKAVSADVYLMNHIEVPGVLVECGFLSNSREAEKLKTEDYQKKLAVAIAVSVSNSLSEDPSGI